MIYLIVGHRGVGKTVWLKTLERIFNQSTEPQKYFFDLDKEIEKTTGKSINELFLKNEKTFRSIERDTLDKLIYQYKDESNIVFIAVGAGFKWLKNIPSFCHVIHLIRETDNQGRVFLDRPPLRKNKRPYEEYMSLYSNREKNYKQIKTESFVLPEKDFVFDTTEKLFFSIKNINLNAIITLNKNSLPNDVKKWSSFIKKRGLWGLRFFELRDDELNDNNLNILLDIIPKEKQLLSFRKLNKSCFLKKELSSSFDWPLEKGEPPCPPTVLSVHKRRQESVDQVCKKLLAHKAHHFKLAVPVKNFTELMQGHLWFSEDPKHRSFLPVSQKGKWRWYRQIFGPQMKWHFIRESLSGVSDQPFLYEHLISQFYQIKNQPILFAAVLGDPIMHSASPAFHREFFAKQGIVFTKITMSERELTKDNLCILQRMGLVFAAVTSPLKKKAFQICDETDSLTQSVQSVNTMIFNNQKWLGRNTDEYGLNCFVHKMALDKKKHVVVWGGGGMKNILEKQFPFADFYSARTGKKHIKTASSVEQTQLKETLSSSSPKKLYPDAIIWAVGRARMSNCQLPPLSWRPRQIIDLNYIEDSPGLEYALLTGAKYLSGKTMFEYQAKKQQEYFSNFFIL